MEKLRPWMQSAKGLFLKHNNFVLDGFNRKMHRIFIDRGANVLFIAHLDTVQKPKIKKSSVKYIYGQGFDDRLGCMIAYNLSEELGADLLLTDLEESGVTTVAYHKMKDYNWIVEFDREGTDVVTYDLDSKEFRQVLGEYWKIGFGSYSDICSIETDVCCFNLGIGHYNSHSKKAFIIIKEMEKQIALFKKFYAANKNIRYEKKIEFDGSGVLCEFCNSAYGVGVYGVGICADCFDIMINDFSYLEREFIVSEDKY